MSLSADEIRNARNAMHLHLMRRVMSRGLPLDYADVVALEARLEASLPMFIRPGVTRYRLRLKYTRGQRVRVVYDSAFRCIVTAYVRRPRAPRSPQ